MVAGRAWCLTSGSVQTLVPSLGQRVDPRACLRLLLDVLRLSGAMAAWIKLDGVEDFNFLCALACIRVGGETLFHNRNRELFYPPPFARHPFSSLSLLREVSLREVFRSGRRINCEHSLRQSVFERKMSDD